MCTDGPSRPRAMPLANDAEEQRFPDHRLQSNRAVAGKQSGFCLWNPASPGVRKIAVKQITCCESADDRGDQAPPRRPVRRIEAQPHTFGDDDKRDNRETNDRADNQSQNEKKLIFALRDPLRQVSNFHLASLSSYTARMPLNLSVTDSLELRQISEDDAFELTGLIDRNRRYLKEWLPWLDRNTNVEDTAQFMGSSQEQALDNNGLTFGIVFEGALAGVIAEVYLDSGNRRTELGYWLADDHQGRGIRDTSRGPQPDGLCILRAGLSPSRDPLCCRQFEKPGGGRRTAKRIPPGRPFARGRMALRPLRRSCHLFHAQDELDHAACWVVPEDVMRS